MNNQLLKWKDEFNIGYPVVDEAHKKLIAVLRHLLEEDAIDKDENIQFKVKEIIKYLRHYTQTHFAEEETYMVEVGYQYREIHRFMHANFRDVILTNLENDLKKNLYSRESIYHFAKITSEWFEKHILIEDRAITGKAISRYSRVADVRKRLGLDCEFKRFIHSFFFKNAELCDWFYDGDFMKETLAHEFIIKDNFGNDYNIICLISKSTLLSILSELIGENITRVDKFSVKAYYNMMSWLGIAIYKYLYPEYNFRFERVEMFFLSDYPERYKLNCPRYSMLWSIDTGYIGLILD